MATSTRMGLTMDIVRTWLMTPAGWWGNLFSTGNGGSNGKDERPCTSSSECGRGSRATSSGCVNTEGEERREKGKKDCVVAHWKGRGKTKRKESG